MFLSRMEGTTEKDKIAWYCQVFGEDAERAGEVGGHSAFLKVEGLDSTFGLKSGVTTLFADEAIISHNLLVIPNGVSATFATEEVDGRKLENGTVDVTKNALVVHVTAPQIETTSSVEELVSNVFGDDGDQYNLKSQMEGCSYGRIKIEKATGENINDGAAQVSITEQSEDRKEMERLVRRELEEMFGTTDLKTVADLILICMPPFRDDWSAYAYYNSPLSFYNDEKCNYPTLQMHEVGHNFNLGHSAQKVYTYGDRSGTMGGSTFEDEGEDSLRCYNAAKTWQLGWFGENNIDLDLVEESWGGRLIGTANFEDSTEQQKNVLLKIAGNYFVQFNYAAGFNSGTDEFINRVTIVKQTGDGDASWVQASLREGEAYVIDDVFDLYSITVKVSKIVTTSDATAFAKVKVYQGERARCIDTCCFENNCGDDSSISVDKDSYQPGEEITVSFSNNSPKSYDWIWIVDGASVDEFGKLSEEWSSEALWLYTCGSKDCSETPKSGDLKFDSSGLQAGRYVAYYLWKDDNTVAVASSPFTVIQDGNTLSPTEEPTPSSYALAVATSASSYSLDEVIEVSFVNPNPTHQDWVAIYSADEPVSEYGDISKNYLLWQYVCGSKERDDCDEIAVFEGSINFDSSNLDAGTYRAYLLFGNDENVLDRSEEFTVGLASCEDVKKFTFLKGKPPNQKVKKCKWVRKKNTNKRCKKKWEGERLDFYCPDSCGLC